MVILNKLTRSVYYYCTEYYHKNNSVCFLRRVAIVHCKQEVMPLPVSGHAVLLSCTHFVDATVGLNPKKYSYMHVSPTKFVDFLFYLTRFAFCLNHINTPFSTCMPNMDRQEPANGTQCPNLTTDISSWGSF